MTQLVLSPTARSWMLLLLLLSGEPMPAQGQEESSDPKGSTCSRLWQHPRFMAQKRGNVMKVHCYANNSLNSSSIQWFWKPKMDVDLQPLPKENDRIQWTTNSTWSTLTLQDVQFEDNGFYVCGGQCVNGTDKVLGFATELRVMGFSSLAQMKRRNTLKDGIIMIQTLLIILFIIVPIFLLLDKDDGKAGMEEDHTYEGLDIDQTATYEDIVTLRTGEVKWSVGEHPGQE
ncbi:B-cell antigen receptor complex-associated protein beta chain isoform X2 [Ochotona curzoniae]|uniref:B-cell antigen receptor complex-associated protein beta chain isoform X2 n=1 Tax=Ochotona curzoniae TaxID=130825 RepID=UPI001B34E6CC|nr:B-cell antigen receptor complex-associated protein beta chain isoform X2 [Ochotona curzoniae]